MMIGHMSDCHEQSHMCNLVKFQSSDISSRMYSLKIVI